MADNDKTKKYKVKKITTKQKRPSSNITYYIGLQNEPLGEEPNISISFGISLRVFSIAFALSKLERKNNTTRQQDTPDDTNTDSDI